MHFGDYNVNGGVREFRRDAPVREAAAEATAAAFEAGDFPG